jgi:DNA mismatch repair protein MutS
VVTPGTVTDSELLNDRADTLLLAVARQRTTWGLAWLGVASGQLGLAECGERELGSWLARLAPAELLVDRDELPAALLQCRAARTRRPAWQFDSGLGLRKLCEQLKVASLAGFNAQELGTAHAAAAALLSYAEHTQGRALAHVNTLSVERSSELIELPPTTHRNLELTETLRGEASPTLLSLLDTCRTGMGSRALRHWLTHPLRDRAQALARHGAIAQMLADGVEPLRELLRGVSDVERITARIACARCGRASCPACARRWPSCRGCAPWPARQRPAGQPARRAGPAAGRGRAAGPRHRRRAGRAAARRRRDRHRLRRRAGRAARHRPELRRLPAGPGGPRARAHRHRQPAGAVQQGARLLHRGHQLRPRQGAGRLPRRQTLKNAERFITPELKAFEDKALSAQERAWPARSGCTSSCSTSCRASWAR